MAKCKLCAEPTETLFNIKLKAVPVCQRCATQIFLQQAKFLAVEAAGRIVELEEQNKLLLTQNAIRND